ALFEYTIPPREALTPEQDRIGMFAAEGSGMHSLPEFAHGCFPTILASADFVDVQTEDITGRVMPMFRRMYRWYWLPYQVIRALRLRRRFVTVVAVAETYP